MASISSSPGTGPQTQPRSRLAAGAVTLGIAVALFFPGLAIHEGLHLVVLHLVGGQGWLIVRPWRFALVDLSLPSLHVQPSPALDRNRQLAVNFFGPALAALIFAIPMLRVRDRRLALAVIANVGALVFYAAIEAGDVLADSINADAAVLGTPEFNYGVPLALFMAAAFLATTRLSASRPSPGSDSRRIRARPSAR